MNVQPGRPAPLGATPLHGGVNFSVFSRSATRLEILLFDRPDQSRPRVIALDPEQHRTYHYWHAFVSGLQPGQLYAYRTQDGPLLDPYARAMVLPPRYDRYALTTANAPKSVVADPSAYDWEGDLPLRRPWAQTIIYELHVAGFTRHPGSGVAAARRGTYAGLVEKIPYLVELGVTAVELLPVFAFDPQDCPRGLTNYWGYAPLGFFAPHPAYSSRRDPLGPLDEFRDMVKAFHRAGLEVILDVVYNHTAEGDSQGPVLSLKGLDNDLYYLLEEDGRYANFSGTGNSLNANQSVVRRLILDSLRYWVQEMHVDGFRFDLASLLARDERGQPLENPPVLWDIESDPILAGTKLIAEAWDAGGLYQVGSFVGDAWQEWNGKFRDDLRSFWKADRNSVQRLAQRLLGSPDVFAHERREAEQSINFITCHDGFTLNDLVSYNHKHNDANGEDNRDGSNDNLSWNCGVEGESDDPQVNALRQRQIKNFLAVTLLALGTPMLSMGDEVRRTQGGNNNAYCHDSELSWFDWSAVPAQAGLRRFVQELTRERRQRAGTALNLSELLASLDLEWHGTSLNQPDWSPDSHSLALTLRSPGNPRTFHMLFNAYWEELEFELPSGEWGVWIDTFQESPGDIQPLAGLRGNAGGSYRAAPRSLVVLVLLTG